MREIWTDTIGATKRVIAEDITLQNPPEHECEFNIGDIVLYKDESIAGTVTQIHKGWGVWVLDCDTGTQTFNAPDTKCSLTTAIEAKYHWLDDDF